MRILLIDDEEAEYILLREMIRSGASARPQLAYELDWVPTYKEGRADIAKGGHDVYLLDYKLGGRSGLDMLREPVAKDCSSPIIMLTGLEDHSIDLAAMHLGAADYLVKDQVTLPLLERSIRYAIERREAERHLQEVVEQRTRDLVQLEQQAQELSGLQKATSALVNTLDLRQLISQILDAAQDAVPTTETTQLVLIDHQGNGSDRLPDIQIKDARVSRSNSPELAAEARQLLRGRQALLIDDPEDKTLRRFTACSDGEQLAACSGLIAPLVLGQELVGVLTLSSSWASAFSQGAQQLFTTFATTASAAMQNAVLYAEIRELATTDPVTGLFNRRTFYDLGQRLLEQAARFGRPISIILLDIDSFKRLNQLHGHAFGDRVLREVAERAMGLIEHGHLQGRYGADELVILLQEADSNMAAEVGEKIRRAVSDAPVNAETSKATVTISVGVAQAAPGQTDLGSLLDCADHALQTSKAAGCNKVTAS
jgi:diguanylate cyclase (GGDEF)-like protein